MAKLTVKDLMENLEAVSQDSGGATVRTAQFMSYVIDDVGEHQADESDIALAFEALVKKGVMERVGRNGYQATDRWLAQQGVSAEEIGT